MKETNVSLSPTVLVGIIAACLSVGSGGAFMAYRAESVPPRAQDDHQQQHVRLERRDVDDWESVTILASRVAVLEALLTESKERLQRIEAKLDRVLSTRER
jgi:hypothetical protein